MQDVLIGIATSVGLVLLFELARRFDLRLVGAFAMVGIAFIYIGFAWRDIPSLIAAIISVSVFLALSFLGYKKNFMLIIAGLILHGIWDIVFPLFSSMAPDGYGPFCLTVDVLLAVYFYIRIKPLRIA